MFVSLKDEYTRQLNNLGYQIFFEISEYDMQ